MTEKSDLCHFILRNVNVALEMTQPVRYVWAGKENVCLIITFEGQTDVFIREGQNTAYRM